MDYDVYGEPAVSCQEQYQHQEEQQLVCCLRFELISPNVRMHVFCICLEVRGQFHLNCDLHSDRSGGRCWVTVDFEEEEECLSFTV